MVNYVIVDDNKSFRKKISDLVLSFMMKNKVDFKIIEFPDFNKDLEDYIKKDTNDTIYILDLELPNGDGIEIARLIRNKYNNWISPIIIITVHTSLYFEVYKQRLQVLDFIGKCDDIDKSLEENINICFKMLIKEKSYRYTYKSINYNIKLSTINYIQREGRKVKIVTERDNYYQNISINEIRKNFPSYFVLSAKGIIINLKNVNKIDWNDLKVYFKDGTEGYLVTKSHRKEIEEYEFI